MDDISLAQETLKFVEDSYNLISKLESEKNDLIQKLAEVNSEKVRLEKVASESSSAVTTKNVFSRDLLVKVAKNLASKSILTKSASEELIDVLTDNPNSALEVINQLSGKLVPADIVVQGSGIPKEAGELNDTNDPDGWYSAIRSNRY